VRSNCAVQNVISVEGKRVLYSLLEGTQARPRESLLDQHPAPSYWARMIGGVERWSMRESNIEPKLSMPSFPMTIGRPGPDGRCLWATIGGVMNHVECHVRASPTAPRFRDLFCHTIASVHTSVPSLPRPQQVVAGFFRVSSATPGSRELRLTVRSLKFV